MQRGRWRSFCRFWGIGPLIGVRAESKALMKLDGGPRHPLKHERKHAMKLIMILGALMLLTNCDKAGPALDKATICAGWQAIPLDPASIDGLTGRDAAAILAHNKFGRSLDCW
jgi:hypothetical protein